MATTFDLLISCSESRLVAARQILTESHRLISRLENELTEFIPTSPIAQINTAEPDAKIAMPESAMELLRISERLRENTRGAFHYLAKSEPLETAELQWDDTRNVAWKKTSGTHVGFGAIGKGYALDKIRSLLESEGFHDYFLSGGGSSLILSGFSSRSVPWKWGWSWEKTAEGEPLGVRFSHDSGAPVSIGVSGTHEKGLHLIDPRSGERGAFAKSALIALPSAAEADALSTALFVGGWDEEILHFAKLSTAPAMAIIDKTSTPRWNGTFQKLWGDISTNIATSSAALCFFLLALSALFPFQAMADDGAVDLGDMGVDDFTPYIFERNYWMILLPLAALAVVLVHLQKLTGQSDNQTNPQEEINET